MRQDNRLSEAVHVLLHLVQHDGPVTSAELARGMDTNPVVIRRLMAGLRENGYVRSVKGHGGGWTLSCRPAAVTLHDIYSALGCPSILAIGNRNDGFGCLVAEAVNAALNQSFREAESLLLTRLGEVTLETLGAEVRSRVAARGKSQCGKKNHE